MKCRAFGTGKKYRRHAVGSWDYLYRSVKFASHLPKFGAKKPTPGRECRFRHIMVCHPLTRSARPGLPIENQRRLEASHFSPDRFMRAENTLSVQGGKPRLPGSFPDLSQDHRYHNDHPYHRGTYHTLKRERAPATLCLPLFSCALPSHKSSFSLISRFRVHKGLRAARGQVVPNSSALWRPSPGRTRTSPPDTHSAP